MILAIDIGNTTISLAILQGLKAKKVWVLETAQPRNALRLNLNRVMRQAIRKAPRIEKIIICSVVPDVLPAVKSALRQYFKGEPLLVGSDIKVPMKNLYRNPRQVGQDRLVVAYAAMKIYGAPVIIIDLGTAITFDVVSSKKGYMGGVIVPGIRLSAESLYKKTAMLPKVGIKVPGALIGRDTQTSILSGLFYGYGMLCQGMIALIKTRVKGRPKVVMTGGYADSMKKFVARQIDAIDRDLVLKGMALLAENYE